MREKYLYAELLSLSPEAMLEQFEMRNIPRDFKAELTYNYALINNTTLENAFNHSITLLLELRNKSTFSKEEVYGLYYLGYLLNDLGNFSLAVVFFEKALVEIHSDQEKLRELLQYKLATAVNFFNQNRADAFRASFSQSINPENKFLYYANLVHLSNNGVEVGSYATLLDSIDYYYDRMEDDSYLGFYAGMRLRASTPGSKEFEDCVNLLDYALSNSAVRENMNSADLGLIMILLGKAQGSVGNADAYRRSMDEAIGQFNIDGPNIGPWINRYYTRILETVIHEKGFQVFMSARQSRDIRVVQQGLNWFELNFKLRERYEQYMVDEVFGTLKNTGGLGYSFRAYNLLSQYLYDQTCDSTYLEEQIQYADYFRANLVKNRLGKRDALAQHGGSSLRKEAALFKAYVDCETDYFLNQDTWEDHVDCRFEKQIDKMILEAELREEYDLPSGSVPFTLDQIRAKLLQDKKTLCYINSGGPNADIVTVITPTDHISYYAAYDKHQLDQRIETLFASIDQTATSSDPEALQDLADQLYRFYEDIFAPAAHLLTGELILLPDGPLARLPYAAFLTAPVEDPTDFRTWPFFARKHQFTLAHSLQTQLRLQQQKPVRKTQLLAYAPLFTKGFAYRDGEAATRYDFSPLENNIDEAAYAARHYGGQTALGEAATKARFLEEAGDYNILHLATHAKMNADFDLLSFVAFGEEEEDRLYSGNIFGLDLPAEMVVLSACETAQGYDLIGEGPMSLSRAFAAAGAKSTVSTLWQVSDRESAQLVGSFYDHLAAGADKDAALRRAQLAMIDGGSIRAAHPFYWAGYVLQGDTRALPPAAGWDWRLVGGGVAIVLGLIYLGRRRSRRQRAA